MQEYIKKILRSGNTTLISSNEEVNDIIKIVQALQDSNVLLKGDDDTRQQHTPRLRLGVCCCRDVVHPTSFAHHPPLSAFVVFIQFLKVNIDFVSTNHIALGFRWSNHEVCLH